MESHLYTSFFPSSFQRMRSTGDIQFFVCRSRIIPEPPFPSQGIAGSGNRIGAIIVGEGERRITIYWGEGLLELEKGR